MKLLQALFFPPEQPGGVSSMIPYLQDKFEPPEWEMELFSLPKRIRGKGTDEIKFHTFDWRQYEHSAIVQKYMQTYRDYLWWTKLRLQQSYDLIHAHHPIAGLAMKEVYPDTPVIQSIHSSYERELILNRKIKEGGPEHRFLCSLYKEMEYRADRMFTVSESFRGYLSPHVDHPEQIGVIRNGFDNKRFKPIPHHNDVVQLVTVCRLVPAKGLDVLLRACAELKRRGISYVLHIIGDGPIREELEQLAMELGIYDETIFYGYTLHPEEFMPFFDIFVLPSRAEAFGSVFAEAALCNLALVGTKIGGIAEQIEDGVNGLLVQPEDHLALAGALEKLIADEEYRSRLAGSGLDKAKNCYSLDRVVHELKNIYLQFKQSSE
ncbi:glycosyltransferase family 4 protein [Paenibacillus woosongensis]|uniref:Glycosyltransferase family 4 protein n=1 Tax=Paenibacillus woosongensis TaxID=307580 RepID=A0AA95KV86_9BACL|nr:glycosyltransferase family 4 protein [Paenibacillus woosongensis]WHX50888.1 glycosyltransferase family 4 protein [Paenibacillus woosongensis]